MIIDLKYLYWQCLLPLWKEIALLFFLHCSTLPLNEHCFILVILVIIISTKWYDYRFKIPILAMSAAIMERNCLVVFFTLFNTSIKWTLFILVILVIIISTKWYDYRLKIPILAMSAAIMERNCLVVFFTLFNTSIKWTLFILVILVIIISTKWYDYRLKIPILAMSAAIMERNCLVVFFTLFNTSIKWTLFILVILVIIISTKWYDYRLKIPILAMSAAIMERNCLVVFFTLFNTSIKWTLFILVILVIIISTKWYDYRLKIPILAIFAAIMERNDLVVCINWILFIIVI